MAKNFSEYGASQRGFGVYIADRHHTTLKYALDSNRFYMYTGTHWQESNSQALEIRQLVAMEADRIRMSMPPKPEKDDPEYYAWYVQATFVKLASSTADMSGVVSMLRSDSRLWCRVSDFSDKPYLINFTNGTVNVREPWLDEEGEMEVYFHNHDPADMLATCLSRPYQQFEFPATPKWDAMLLHMCGGDISYARSLERALAYGLIGENPEQVMIFLVGEPNIGKSQVLEIVAELAGSLAGFGKIELIQKTYTEHESLRSDLRGKHFVVLGEASSRLVLDEAKFKDLTGASFLPTRKLHQEPMVTKVSWTLYCATNELPELPGEMSDSVARRLWLFPLPGKQIPVTERDTTLTQQILAEEGNEILYKFARYLSEWYAFGKTPVQHARSMHARDEYQAESNTVQDFARVCLHEDSSNWVSYEDLHQEYVKFCRSYNVQPVSRRQLPKRVEEVMLTCTRDSNHSRIKGVALSYKAPWQS